MWGLLLLAVIALALPGPLSAFRVVDFPQGGQSLRYTLFHMR